MSFWSDHVGLSRVGAFGLAFVGIAVSIVLGNEGEDKSVKGGDPRGDRSGCVMGSFPLEAIIWRARFWGELLAFAPALVASLILAATTMVRAESPLLPDQDACWERNYDNTHLQAHPKQQVVQIRLFHLPSRWPQPAPGVTFVALEMNLRTRIHGSNAFDYGLGAFCKPSGDGLRCEPEWRAGSWRIEPGANGSLIVHNDDISVNPSSSAAEERSEDAVTLKAANDESAWRLQRMSGPCNYDATAQPVR
jgi:hypothetical protein